jgi:type IV fimbrial biogenesis protein FimT
MGSGVLIMNKSSHGFTLIEIMITLAVFALLIMIGLPGMMTWLQNTQIRTSAETMQMGLQFARAEALRRNVPVRFQLVDSLNAGCALSDTGSSWVVNLGIPTLDVSGVCDQAESEDVDRRILQKRSGAEGTSNATVVARGDAGIAASSVVFNGLGRVSPAFAVLPITQIDIRNAAGVCQDKGGRLRCLRVMLSNGGDVRMCDPAVDPAIDKNDPRLC